MLIILSMQMLYFNCNRVYFFFKWLFKLYWKANAPKMQKLQTLVSLDFCSIS